MAIGSTIGLAQALSEYRAMASGKLIGEAFDDLLEVTMSNSNVLDELQGGEDDGKPFVVKQDLEKGAKDRVNYPVATTLGQAPRMGTDQLVGYEEALIQGNWQVRIDNKRIAVGWNEIVAAMGTTGKSWRETYAELVGMRFAQIEQEDMLHRLLQRRVANITIYPGNKTSIDALRTADNLDVDTIKRGAGRLRSLGTAGATVGKTRSGRPVQKYICFGADASVRQVKDETAYLTPAVAQVTADGDGAAIFTGDYLPVDGHLLKAWDIVDHDNPGPIGSAILPKAILGEPITSATAAFDLYGSGRTQASLGDQAPIYTPFIDFPGYLYKFFSEDAPGADGNTYYFVVYDQTDGKWNVYSYVGSTGNVGTKITINARLSDGDTTGVDVTTLAGWSWDSTQNKKAFPTGSIIIPVNAHLVPYGFPMMWGKSAGGKAYGSIKNKRITNVADYGAHVGFGLQSIYGCDVRLDTLGAPRGYIVMPSAVQHEGISLPVIT